MINKKFLGISHGLVQVSLIISDALVDTRQNTTTSLSWIRLEVKKETSNGLNRRDEEGNFPYSSVAQDRDRLDAILSNLESKMEAAFEASLYRPRALNFGYH